MTKQDDKQRARRRLQTQAVELAANNRWQEAATINLQILESGEDVDTLNRLGKTFFELGKLEEARDYYQRALRITPNNPIARKNIERIEDILTRGATLTTRKGTRQLVDLRLFITEVGKTALTTLVDVPRRLTSAIVTGEKVDLRVEGRHIYVVDLDDNTIGRLEPKLAQRVLELMQGGNRYAAAIAQISGHQIRLLLREVSQDPSQRGRISFPGKLSESALRGGFISGVPYDDYGDEMLDDEEGPDDRDETEEESFGSDEEELGLDELEQDLGDDDDMNEE